MHTKGEWLSIVAPGSESKAKHFFKQTKTLGIYRSACGKEEFYGNLGEDDKKECGLCLRVIKKQEQREAYRRIKQRMRGEV